MGVVSSPALVLVTVLVMVSGVCGVFDGFNGKPRPAGMDDAPTKTLGAKPVAQYLGKPADCIWYAWENFNYPPEDTGNCSASLWEPMSQDPKLTGFQYYGNDAYYDEAAGEDLCTIGCFNLAASGPSAPPASSPRGSAPPEQAASPPALPPVSASPPEEVPSPPAVPPTTATPPASTAVPPTATATPPVTSATPPLVAPPPPATLFRPPPPGAALPPTTTGSPTDGPVPSTGGASALRVFPALIAAAVVLGLAI